MFSDDFDELIELPPGLENLAPSARRTNAVLASCSYGCEFGYDCQTLCQSSCQNSGEGTCASSCQISCEAQDGCGTICQVTCTSSCETVCETAVCQTYCQSNCQENGQSTCISYCQTNCQGCMTACEASKQTYTASVGVTFDANGGSVSPTYRSGSITTTSQWGAYVSIVFPTPTRSGYTFLYWLLDGYTTQYSAGTNDIWGDVGGSSYTARAQWKASMSQWSWYSSNGSATAAQTQQFYNVLCGTALPENGFSYLVWNDLVDKAQAVVSAAKPGVGWTNYGGLSSSGCKVSAGETFSAAKYNCVRYNLGSIISTGISDKYSGDEIKGYYITTLTDTINSIINTKL